MNDVTAVIRIARIGTPGYEFGELATYEIPYSEGWSVLDALNYIYTYHDGTLIHPFYCRSGFCTGCLIDMNGKKVLACKTPMLKEMTIRPADENDVVRDLIETGHELTPRHE